MAKPHTYTDELRRVKSLLIVTSLQKRPDQQAMRLVKGYGPKLNWKPLAGLLIEQRAWEYVIAAKRYDPKLVFCHPDILLHNPATSIYYRGLCGLSLKAVRDYFGAVDSLEAGNPRARLDRRKAVRMARTYNAFVCSIINNSTDWTLDNGYRTIVATLGITLDGVMRNKVGSIAEERIRTMVLDWLHEHKLVVKPILIGDQIYAPHTNTFSLRGGVIMQFGSEPDISFTRDKNLLAVIEIKGGIDPAGALERYGAATKSFQHAITTSVRCKNFYVGAVFTPELRSRIEADRLVEKTFNVIEILHDRRARDKFFKEVFHHTLRIV
jgi:hypothetical protein